MEHNTHLVGHWSLIPSGYACTAASAHRLDLLFEPGPDGPVASVVARGDGPAIRVHSVVTVGRKLRLRFFGQLHSGGGSGPTLVMQDVGGFYEGAWDRRGMEHMRLKLVRSLD